ncbi:MAG TPA: DNA polymerase III subunit epsilon [Rickettsiales bacterium]|nr:DNA polymerase III subunit epsilon [Rickettsiales bacterium]
MREIALDTETTGLDPLTGHRVIEIGCVEMFDRIRTGKTFQAYINPERDMPEEAFRVHGISLEFLKDKPVFAKVAQEWLDFIGDSRLVIHNAQFDLKFLNYELGLLKLPSISMDRATDTINIARRKFPGAPAKLDALCKRFNIDLSARTKHGALLDAELLADVYLELMGGRQEAMLLQAEPANASLSSVLVETVTEIITIVKREFPPSEDELAAHEEFLKKIKNPLWKVVA